MEISGKICPWLRAQKENNSRGVRSSSTEYGGGVGEVPWELPHTGAGLAPGAHQLGTGATHVHVMKTTGFTPNWCSFHKLAISGPVAAAPGGCRSRSLLLPILLAVPAGETGGAAGNKRGTGNKRGCREQRGLPSLPQGRQARAQPHKSHRRTHHQDTACGLSTARRAAPCHSTPPEMGFIYPPAAPQDQHPWGRHRCPCPHGVPAVAALPGCPMARRWLPAPARTTAAADSAINHCDTSSLQDGGDDKGYLSACHPQ